MSTTDLSGDLTPGGEFVITYDDLLRKHACLDQCVLFRKLFGESVRVTEELCDRHALDFDFHWALARLAPQPIPGDIFRQANDVGQFARIAQRNAYRRDGTTADERTKDVQLIFDGANRAYANLFWRAVSAPHKPKEGASS